MRHATKEKIKNGSDAFLFAVVAYYVIDFMNVTNIENLLPVLPHIISAEYIAFFLKKRFEMSMKNRNSRYRKNELKTIRTFAGFGLFIAVSLLLATTIEQHSQYKPYTTITQKVADIFTGQVQAYESSNPVVITSQDYLPNQAELPSGDADSVPQNGSSGINYTVTDMGITVTNPLETHLVTSEQITQYITTVFGSEAAFAISVAECESGLNPTIIGDSNLMVLDPITNEMVGDSVGIFQIRTGGISNGVFWNRASENGMTAEEFRKYLSNPKNNIDYAKQLHAQLGWQPWSCAR